MGLLSMLVGGGTTDAVSAIGNAFDKIFTSDEEKLQAEAVLNKIAQKPHLLQAEINKIEASHRSLFVAGWRPFIGWVCGIAFAYHFVLAPLAITVMRARGIDIELPAFEMSSLMTVLMGMLGLGGLRTFEKLQGRAK